MSHSECHSEIAWSIVNLHSLGFPHFCVHGGVMDFVWQNDVLSLFAVRFSCNLQYSDAYVVGRAGAIHCVRQFILRCPNALVVNLPQFLQGLLSLHKDQSADVRKEMCQSLCCESTVSPSCVFPPLACMILKAGLPAGKHHMRVPVCKSLHCVS